MDGSTEYKDALYASSEVGVETDGAVAHPPEAHWRDRHRDNAAATDGIITLRYSWADVTQRPCDTSGPGGRGPPAAVAGRVPRTPAAPPAPSARDGMT